MSNIIGLGDNVPFETRLAETIAWRQAHVKKDNPKESLRSSLLKPAGADSRYGVHLYTMPFERDRLDTIRTVTTVIQTRSTVLQQQSEPVLSKKQHGGGRLLAYFPDRDLSDGAAEVASNGFFDAHNVPAWDSWVAIFYDGDYRERDCQYVLVSWVPPEYLDLVSEGIDVNPEECIVWLADKDHQISHALKKSGLLF